MRTLKTITAILPMTLLLACGGGGGGYSSAPAPSIQPNPVFSEADISTAEIDEVEIIEEAADGNDAFTIAPQTITVENFKHDSFGDWEAQKGWVHGVNPVTGELGWQVYGEALTYGAINPTFNGATYRGDTVTRRTSGEIEPGNVHITLKVNQSTGDLKKMKFKFVGSDYEWNKNLKFGKNAQYNGHIFTTNKYNIRENENGRLQQKGIRGSIFGENADLIMGTFGHKKSGVELGTFGAERDDVEFK
ncbi:MAG: hypothetical protein OXF29_05000 [Hyphomicrobiales bacterium]|nr:hypothetical protein [Hyphomicrobiales bacterium]